MISLATALKLKEIGLVWKPTLHDFFAIPDVGLDDRIFVLSDMTVGVEVLHGFPAITFNGAVEWSLDFVYQYDVVWIPKEEQLRQLVYQQLALVGKPIFQLAYTGKAYTCTIQHQGRPQMFAAKSGDESYARALLHLLGAPAAD